MILHPFPFNIHLFPVIFCSSTSILGINFPSCSIHVLFAFISFHFDNHVLLILFISFFPFVPSMFVFIFLHFAFVFFHVPFISFQFPFISFYVAFISFHFASVSFHFALEILSLTPDMAIENGNRAFYVQFLQPISLKESRKVPSVFALFMNIAVKKMHRKWCWQWCMWINVCVCNAVLYSMCIPSNHFLVNGSFV